MFRQRYNPFGLGCWPIPVKISVGYVAGTSSRRTMLAIAANAALYYWQGLVPGDLEVWRR